MNPIALEIKGKSRV